MLPLISFDLFGFFTSSFLIVLGGNSVGFGFSIFYSIVDWIGFGFCLLLSFFIGQFRWFSVFFRPLMVFQRKIRIFFKKRRFDLFGFFDCFSKERFVLKKQFDLFWFYLFVYCSQRAIRLAFLEFRLYRLIFSFSIVPCFLFCFVLSPCNCPLFTRIYLVPFLVLLCCKNQFVFFQCPFWCYFV